MFNILNIVIWRMPKEYEMSFLTWTWPIPLQQQFQQSTLPYWKIRGYEKALFFLVKTCQVSLITENMQKFITFKDIENKETAQEDSILLNVNHIFKISNEKIIVRKLTLSGCLSMHEISTKYHSIKTKSILYCETSEMINFVSL